MKTDKVKRKSKTNSNEYLLNNIIDEEFQAAWFPLGILQSLFLMSRFRIIKNFITPNNNVFFYVKTLTGLIIFVLCEIFGYVVMTKFVDGVQSGVLVFIVQFEAVYILTALVIVYTVSALHRNNVVELIIQLQKVLNLIKIDKISFLLKHKFYNWISFLTLCSFYIGNIFLASTDSYFSYYMIAFCFSKIQMMIFDLPILNFITTIVLMKDQLEAWNQCLREMKNIDVKYEEATESQQPSENDMLNAYVHLLKAFRLCNKVYQLSFIRAGFATFMNLLMNLEYIFETGKAIPEDNIFDSSKLGLYSIAWNTKNFLMVITMSIACENFYGTVKNTESSCAQILQNSQATGMRQICKNVLRLNRATVRKMSAFGMFHLDAAFPLRLFSVLMSYTVVLLQFTFLKS